ncbi:MAG: isoprenylcysteine carboxylmethyltransferase family protein, partial [Armatimonadota bacterium]|nr:isoprenylcysteine carboxylmethyltransferase family protein [Armatimonadota bacterium]
MTHNPATTTHDPIRKTTTRWRLRLTGLGGLALYLMAWQWGQPEMARWSLPLGAAIVTAGMLLRMWAVGWLCKNQILVTGGPYALIRNPLYLGTLLITIGQSFMSAVPLALIVFPALWLAVYWPTIRGEEDYLATRFGAEFEAYRARVPLLLPRLWRACGDTSEMTASD